MTYYRYMDGLPPSIHGFVCRDADGDYTVIINPAMSHEMQIETARHENDHISEDYGEEDILVDLVEQLRHNKK